MQMPEVGFGTYRLLDSVAQKCVLTSLECGYRHIDTAQIYDNEKEVGNAVQKSGIDRNQIFITTKVWLDRLTKDKVLPSLRESLNKLQTHYVDLTLIHWPSKTVPLAETLHELMMAKEKGLTKEIGISNFPIAEMKKAFEIVGAKNIYTNQIEVHPYLQNRNLVQFCKDNGIRITAYMSLAVGKVAKDPVLMSIAHKHNVTASEVALSWCLDKGLVTIPSSTNSERIRQNFKIPHNILTHEDHAQIEKLERGERIANPSWAPNWDL